MSIPIDQKWCPCGGIILADTEDWKTPLCNECYEAADSLDHDPESPVQTVLKEKKE